MENEEQATNETEVRDALKQLVRHGLLRFTSGGREQWEFTHALAHQFARTNADPALLINLGQWTLEEFDRTVVQVRSSGDLSVLGSVLTHAITLLRADEQATMLSALQSMLLAGAHQWQCRSGRACQLVRFSIAR
jgi:hypothetical protein